MAVVTKDEGFVAGDRALVVAFDDALGDIVVAKGVVDRFGGTVGVGCCLA